MDCAFTSPVKAKYGMCVMCRIQCSVSVSAVS